jgi:hypothetical protein
MANPNAGLATLSNPLRPDRQTEYNAAKDKMNEAYASKSVEGDDAAMWGALAKGFAAPAQNFWMSLANAGGAKANVVAGIEAEDLKHGREAAKSEYDHASKLLLSSDAIDRTLVGANAKLSVGSGAGKFVPTGVAGTMINNVTGQKLILQDADKPLMGQIYLKNKEIYGTAEDALQATFLEVAKLKENPVFPAGEAGARQGSPAKVVNPAPTGAETTPVAAPSVPGAGASSPQNTPILKPPAGPSMNRPISLASEVNIQDAPPGMLEAVKKDLVARGDVVGVSQIDEVLKGLEAQKAAAEKTGNTQLAGAVQNNINRVKSEFPQTKSQTLETESKAASAPKKDAYTEGVPSYNSQVNRFTDPKERQEYIKATPVRFEKMVQDEIAPISATLKDVVEKTKLLVELQNTPDPHRPGAKLGTGHTLLDNLPGVGSMWQDFRAGADSRLQQMQAITIDAAMAKRIAGTGTMTDRDMIQYMQAAVGINKDPKANENIYLQSKALAERWNEYVRYAAKFYNTHGDFDTAALKSSFKMYSDANPLFDGFDKNGNVKINKVPSFEEYFRKNKSPFYTGAK